MALAYTAPTWENGGGVGISASQLQALSDCMEGLVQGSDKAITNIAISGQTITLTFADGSQEAGTASGLKGISSIAKTGTSGNVDTYTITYTDGSTSTFTVTNGADGSFYIVTAGIKSTDDPYGNIEYYIGGDFYKNGVLYNQSAFYKVTLVNETEYPPSPYLIDGSSGTFTNGHYSTGSIGGIPSGATITTQIFTDSTMATLLGEVKVLIGLQGSEGEQGPQGPAGDDGVSPEVTITTITGGHRVNITDADHPSGQSFDVMDGQGTGDMRAAVYDANGDVANAGGIAGYVEDAISENVVANPTGTATGTLTKLGIGSDIYDIQGGGGTDKADISAIGTNETGATASKAYAIGEHFYKNGKFCTAKAAIAQGATFTLGTNYVEGTVADCMSKKDLLWTNPNIVISTSYNPNVTFAAQSLDAVTNLMDYDYFAIDVLLHTFRNYMNTVIIPNDVSTATVNWEMVNIISPSPSGNLLARRNIAFDGSTHKLTFSNGMYLPSYGGASTTDDNHFIVPYKIYGIKL